jgi:hypothetical protein
MRIGAGWVQQPIPVRAGDPSLPVVMKIVSRLTFSVHVLLLKKETAEGRPLAASRTKYVRRLVTVP